MIKFEKESKKIKLDSRSKYLRQLVLKCLFGGDRGHMGSAMSLIEILRVLYDKVLKYNPRQPLFGNRDRLILSKGHGCLALYAILSDKGFFSKKILKSSSRFDSILGGHPEFDKVPGVEASTGALGHGSPIGLGIALGAKLEKKKFHTYVIVGDGEINEGSFWEASMIASKHKLSNYHIIIDYNKIQSYGQTKDVMQLEPLKDKLSSFGYKVDQVNGHDIKQLIKYFKKIKNNNKPSALISHTIKGKGFYFAEQNPFWHHKNFFTDEEKNKLVKCLEK
ncbi:MAG: transketolase [Legionellales bacterium]|nr:transketolase [Legionellales bacterium]|tara:strand:+ start:201 stop:1034 length:834 start_codon:yes stop_codon:yes gene_type:complete